MKIIADTNIWYGLGQDENLFAKVKKDPIAPTFANIHELSKSENLIDKEDLSRSAIQMLFKFKENTIYEPPFIYLTKLKQEYKYDIISEIGHWLEFTSKFAVGHSISPDKLEEFKQEILAGRESLEEVAKLFNNEAENIRNRILDKKAHKKIDTYQITAEFINFCVEQSTKGKVNIDGFELGNIELLVKTLDHFFKTLETSHMKVQANDWYDFAILAYVQPGDKYWTREKRWQNLINDAGCGHYLITD
ncbi:hypothetical protein ACMDB5_10095 [Flavobacterium sp. W1B]|uniref:hypothetical protein n=1 Tax=Flavobacterium sp. W1B TaxID=3394146 RepID=UPI0039BD11B7